jgi:hypothetical protein
VAVAEVEVEVEVEVETVGNDGKQVVTAVSRQQQWQMDSDGDDSLEWRVSWEVCVRAIGDWGMSGRHHWWTRGVALVGLWDSGPGSMRNKWKKDHGRLYCINGADYGCGGCMKAGLCTLNRQERWRWLQEQTETMRSV